MVGEGLVRTIWTLILSCVRQVQQIDHGSSPSPSVNGSGRLQRSQSILFSGSSRLFRPQNNFSRLTMNPNSEIKNGRNGVFRGAHASGVWFSASRPKQTG